MGPSGLLHVSTALPGPILGALRTLLPYLAHRHTPLNHSMWRKPIRLMMASAVCHTVWLASLGPLEISNIPILMRFRQLLGTDHRLTLLILPSAPLCLINRPNHFPPRIVSSQTTFLTAQSPVPLASGHLACHVCQQRCQGPILGALRILPPCLAN